MPWCPWCKSYHSKYAQHIAREMYLLVMDEATSESMLFRSKASAKRMGYSQADRPILKVTVTPHT